ncbi:MAG TPA: adenylate/guanylate cyclase domain-containing protein [Acidimicrobiales bacterium]|nr:adenylate/guanylate cyclase domain-containing protein [Acidimicrobiales bacterium]
MAGSAELERLAQLTGEPVEELRRWIEAGVLRAVDADRCDAKAVAMVRLVQLLGRRGFDFETIARAAAHQPALFARYRDQIVVAVGDVQTIEDAARAQALDPRLLRRLWEASGFADHGDVLGADDVRALRSMAAAIEAGIPEDALVQLVRVYADAFARVTEAETRLFHFQVHGRLRAEGRAGAALAAGADDALAQVVPLIEPALLYFHGKALARSVGEDIAIHLAEDASLIPLGDPTGQVPMAVAFVDLARFTSMTEAMGDLAAADVLDRFSELTRRAVIRAGGRVVKQIGDEFMLVFPDVPSAVTAALEIQDAAAAEPSFLATRIGLHHGMVVCREGDYVGATVNLAARLTGEAAAHQLLASDAVVAGARALADVEFVPVGARALKGIDSRVEVHEVRRRLGGDVATVVDPVCGMSVDPSAEPPSATFEGRQVLFCSATCRDRFVADPARYRAGPFSRR